MNSEEVTVILQSNDCATAERELAAVQSELKNNKELHDRLLNEYAHVDTEVRKLALSAGIPQDVIDGDSYSVPGIEELVELIVQKLTAAQAEIAKQKSDIARFEALNKLLSESELAKKNQQLIADCLSLRQTIQDGIDWSAKREAENVRLNRERDEARTKVQRFDDEWDAAQVEANFEPIPFGRDAVLTTIEDVKLREAGKWKDRVKRLEEESESRWLLAQSAIGSCAEMLSRIKRLEEAGDKILSMAEHKVWATDAEIEKAILEWNAAKEALRTLS